MNKNQLIIVISFHANYEKHYNIKKQRQRKKGLIFPLLMSLPLEATQTKLDQNTYA